MLNSDPSIINVQSSPGQPCHVTISRAVGQMLIVNGVKIKIVSVKRRAVHVVIEPAADSIVECPKEKSLAKDSRIA